MPVLPLRRRGSSPADAPCAGRPAPCCRLLRPGGIYSFFNGLAPDNLFFHLVYCEIAKMELKRCAFILLA